MMNDTHFLSAGLFHDLAGLGRRISQSMAAYFATEVMPEENLCHLVSGLESKKSSSPSSVI